MIVHGLPPIYNEIVAHGITPPETAVYTYGDDIYIPSGGEPDAFLIRHEQTHVVQQSQIGARVWWTQWIADLKFRVDQEVEAYQKQLRLFRTVRKDRNEQARFAFGLAQQMSGPMYGYSITFEQAFRRIRA